MYRHFFKRFFDFWIALIALVCISPLLLCVTVWLHFANKGAGAFFLQERPGLHGKIFRVIKFKTMTDEKDCDGNLLPDEQRLTKVGKFVRSTSIDELIWRLSAPVRCWFSTCRSTRPSRRGATRYVLEYRAGRNVTDAMPYRGGKNSHSTYGM